MLTCPHLWRYRISSTVMLFGFFYSFSYITTGVILSVDIGLWSPISVDTGYGRSQSQEVAPSGTKLWGNKVPQYHTYCRFLGIYDSFSYSSYIITVDLLTMVSSIDSAYYI